MTNEQKLWECKKQLQKVVSKKDYDNVINGGIKIIRFKNDVLVSEADAMSVTFGLFNQGLPEMVFLNGPSTNIDLPDHHFNINEIEAEVSEIISFAVSTRTIPDVGLCFNLSPSKNEYVRMEFEWTEEYPKERFILTNLFATAYAQNSLDVDMVIFQRQNSPGETKVSLN